MRRLLPVVMSLTLAACASDSVRSVPTKGSVIPAYTLKVSPTVSVALEKIVYWGALAGAVYLILDPLAPNWEIEEAPIGDDMVHFSMRMKRYYAGGAGEAQALFHRHAKETMRYNGFDGYKVIDYQEALESSVLGSQRVASGVVQLTRSSER